MTNHVVADQLYTGDFATIRDAYRVGEGNSTIRAECDRQVIWSWCGIYVAVLLVSGRGESYDQRGVLQARISDWCTVDYKHG